MKRLIDCWVSVICWLNLRCFCTVLLLCISASVQASERKNHQRLDAHFQRVLAKHTVQLQDQLQSLLSVAATDEDKVYLIYKWVTHNFKHDSRLAHQIGNPDQYSLDKLHKLGGGSCAVYANVTHRLLQSAGIEVKTIYGLAKGAPASSRRYGKPVNHVWNAVRINGVWSVLDTTWGAGYVGKYGFRREPSNLFFMMPAEKTVLSHFDVVDELGFQKQLGVDRALFSKIDDDALYAAAVGFNPKVILESASKRKNQPLVLTYDLEPHSLSVIDAPVKRVLERKAHNFLIETPVFEELMMVQGRHWVPLTKRATLHSLEIKPVQGELIIMGRRSKQDEFEALLGYHVQ